MMRYLYTIPKAVRMFRASYRPQFPTLYLSRPCLCSKSNKEGSQRDAASKPLDNRISVNEYQLPFQAQWEEDPDFDYAKPVTEPTVYPFISPHELFSLEELRLLLQHENIRDLVFLRLPQNHVSEYMVIGSGLSKTHVRSTSSLVYKILKYKRRSSSLGLPRIDGLDRSCDWIVIHLENILLHLFLPEVRAHYDLESLWIAGPEYDEATQGFASDESQSSNTSQYPSKIDWDQLVREVQLQRKISRAITDPPSDKDTH